MKNLFLTSTKATNRMLGPIFMENLGLIITVFILDQSLVEFFRLMVERDILFQWGSFEFLSFKMTWTEAYGKAGEFMSHALRNLTLFFALSLRGVENRRNLERRSLGDFTKKIFIPTFVESLRVFASVILWTLVFIVPGIIKSVRYYYVPFVVMFNPRYKKGEIDALDYSARISRGCFVITVFVILVDLLAQNYFDSLTKGLRYAYYPLQMFYPAALTVLVSAYTLLFLLNLYLTREDKEA